MTSTAFEITLPNGRTYEQPTGLFINNTFVEPNGDKFTVYNPSYGAPFGAAYNNPCVNTTSRTDEEIVTLSGASEGDVDTAIRAARHAFEGKWSELAAIDRGELLYKLAELIRRDRELLAAIEAFNNGKTYSAALTGDIDGAYNVFRYYAGAADKITGRTIETSPAKLAYVLQEPISVCGQIIP